MEFVEMLKVDEKFLYSLLTLSQEQNIKTGRFAMIYADEVILSHTNENEYTAFVGNRKSEALQDRIILVKVDRKSTRLNSSHANISYAVFCLKKKNRNERL